MGGKNRHFRLDYQDGRKPGGILAPAALFNSVLTQQEFSARFNSHYSFLLVQRIWNICFVTLSFDLLLLMASVEILGIKSMEQKFYTAVNILICLSLLAYRREKNFALLRKMKEAYLRDPGIIQKALLLAGILFGLVLLVQVSFAIAEGKFLSAILPLVLYGSSIYMLWQSVKRNNYLPAHKIRSLNSFEQEILLLSLAPIVIARLLSLTAALYSVCQPNPVFTFLPYLLITVLMLFEAQPKKGMFVMGCRGCGRKIPRSQLSGGRCSVCLLRRKAALGSTGHNHSPVRRRYSSSIPASIRQLLQAGSNRQP